MPRSLPVCLILLFTVCASIQVFAGGRKDNESHEVDNPSGFSESLDIEDKKPGKWNIYMEARDNGGNSAIAGPYNIYIDPESDLPVARIINPQPNLHVQGNLNIVGTCIDDDGVDYVELVITRGSDGKGEVMLQTRANGSEFWSYFLDTTDTDKWRDGPYTITAWGVDINGLSGISDSFPAKSRKKHTIVWNLDRKRPEIKVTSHSMGDLVSGKTAIKGTVWDGNGIDFLFYSVDRGEHYLPVNFNYDKKADIYTYNLSLDTRIFDDGPAIIEFKARDKMKSEGYLSFLINANNSTPDVQILYPAPGEKVSGIFTVAGFAAHKVGLSSLTWKLGKESGHIPLITGNPWWVKEFDIRGQNVKSLDLEIRAVDFSGNVTVAKRKITVDQDAGMPRVAVTQPVAGDLVPGDGLRLTGNVTGNTAVDSIFYSIDGKTPVQVSCSGYFQLTVKDIPDGIHTLDVWARNINNVAGPKTTIKNIIAPGIAPEPKITQVHSGSGKTAVHAAFYPGIELNNDAGSSFDLSVRSGSGIQSIIYQLGTKAPLIINVKGTRGGVITQNIPLPKDMDYGQAQIEIRAKDMYGRETVMEDYITVTGAGGQRGYAADGLTWVQPDTSPGNGRILLSTRESLTGIFSGGPIQSVQAVGNGADSLDINVDENGNVRLLGRFDGSYGPIRFTINSASGTRYTSGGYSFLVDSTPPELEMIENPAGSWVQDKVRVKFRVSDVNRIKTVDYSIDSGSPFSWQPLLQGDGITGLAPDSVIDRVIDISQINDGAVTVNIRVTDEANRETIGSLIVNKDTMAPEPVLIVPVSGARVNGTIQLGFAVKEAGKLASVFYERPETETDGVIQPAITRQVFPNPDRNNTAADFLDLVLDATQMPLAGNMSFTFTDAAGNRSTFSEWPFIIDQEMDLPVVHISLPVENEVITSDFIVSGICYDDDQIKQIHWRLDDGIEQVIEAKNGFSIPVSLSSLTDNIHSVTVYAEDIYGVKGESETRSFRVSLEEPIASVSIPAATDIVGGLVTLVGVAIDNNGIRQVQVSLDNGNTYNNADGDARWNYSFNSKIIPDGNHAVFIKVWDNYDVNAVYSYLINIDNTSPELSIDTPSDGAETTGPLYITGNVMDNMKLESVSVTLSSLDGVEIPPPLAKIEAKLDSLILEEMDLGSLPDGNYNVEIWAADKAKNISRISRNIVLAKENNRNFVDTLYPLNGEQIYGNFNIYGYVGGLDKAGDVTLAVNGLDTKTETVSETGYFRFSISPGELDPGLNTLVVHSDFGGHETVQSAVRNIEYRSDGPWVTVDTMGMGDFAHGRPWLMGRAGYELSDSDRAILADKKADKDIRADTEAKKVSLVELSFNNGRTFFAAGKSGEKNYDWRYRLETQDMTEGLHYLIVRATMVNGEIAVTRLLIQVDKTPPVIRLISPQPGGRYNKDLVFAALASDNVELKGLTYHLRQGDKSAYEIPGFIKGLYFEATIPPVIRQVWNSAPSIFAGGATFMDVGFGLSFFGDNVKIQAQYGLMTQSLYESIGGTGAVRYGGHVLGFKILANIYTLPFTVFGGPDWEWLSASFTLGANFSLFDLLHQGYTQSGNSTWMSAVLAQIEFPRITIPGLTYLRTFSLFTEGQLWFVPTDVNAKAHNIQTIIPHITLGLRMYIF